MKTRTTLVLVGLFGAILAYWLLFERHAKKPEEAARDAKKVFQAEGQEVRTLTIERPDQPRMRLERSVDKWKMLEPVSTRAEKWSADAAAGALLEMTASRTIINDRGDKGLEEMGLKPARAKVTFTLAPKAATASTDRTTDAPAGAPAASEAPGVNAAPGTASGSASPPPGTEGSGTGPSGSAKVLEIGGSVPTTESVFVRAEGRDEIAIVPSSSVSALLRTAGELRDRALLDTTALEVFETRIERKGSDTLLFRRREGEWWMEQPLRDAAEGSVVQGILTTLIGLRADSFEDAAAATAGGLDAPEALVRLAGDKGASIADVAFGMEVGGESPGRHVRVTAPGEPPVAALVPSTDLSTMMGPAASFRARHALVFRSWDASELVLTSAGVKLSFVRKDGAWTASSPAGLEVSHEAVDATLQEISDLQIVDFDAAAGKPPSALGLAPERTKIEIRIGDPSPRHLTLVLGAVAESPNVLYASTRGRPVFTVPSSILGRIQPGASLYERKPPPPPAPSPASGASGATGASGGSTDAAAPGGAIGASGSDR